MSTPAQAAPRRRNRQATDQHRAVKRTARVRGETGPARHAPLDKTQSYEPSQVKALEPAAPEVAAARQAQRYRMLDGLRQVSSKPRLRRCKTPIGNSHTGVVPHPDGTAHLTGVESCAGVWDCPVCGPKIRAARMADVMTAIELHEGNDGGFVFGTVTLAHNKGDLLVDLLKVLGDMMVWMGRQRAYKQMKKRLGIIGDIRALEVTCGCHGWHPHRHYLYLTEGQVSDDAVAAFEAIMFALQTRYLLKIGWKPGRERTGVRLDPVRDGADAAGKYVTKLQASWEMTRSDLKKSRAADGHGAMPFDLLAIVIDRGPEEAAAELALWREYEQAMKGKSAVRFSRGLRGALGMGAEASDEELAEDQAEEADVLVYLSAPLARRMARAGHRAALLASAGRASVRDVLRLCHTLYGDRVMAEEDEDLGRLVVRWSDGPEVRSG